MNVPPRIVSTGFHKGSSGLGIKAFNSFNHSCEYTMPSQCCKETRAPDRKCRIYSSSSSSSSASSVVIAIPRRGVNPAGGVRFSDAVHSRSKSRCPLWVMRRPPFSSSFSSTPIFSRACITLRSTLPLASTWCEGREPRLRVEPCTFRRRPTPTVLRR